MPHDPTPEQGAALDLFRFGDNLAIEAGAGTGKTTTLRMIGADASDRTGQYVAFNRAIVLEAQRTMPSNVAANTMHSLAMGAIGYRYRGRLSSSARQPGDQVARFLGIDPLVVTFGQQHLALQPAFLAGLVQRAVTVFCQTADDLPEERHVPYVEGIDVPTADGRRGWSNNREVRRHVSLALRRAWLDVQKVEGGRLRFRHEHYLKMWQLSHPRLPVDFLMCDEAQDTSPVMLDVVARQDAQLVFVGDSQQQIYDFTGAVNALAKVPAQQRVMLTQSFRFGHEIAAVANHVLTEIGADLRLRGLDSITSKVARVDAPRCVLTRTNATAVNEILQRQKAGEHVHLVGGGTEVLTFAKAARELQRGQTTWHPELACFTTWGEVQAYVEQDPQGSELALLVTLVDTYGVETIVAALERMCTEEAADVVVSTAHKAKGREWESVQMADDFPDPRQSFAAMLDPEAALPELRLAYVAATRAQLALDVTRVPVFDDLPKQAALEAGR